MISERHRGGPNTRFRRVLPSTILSVLPVGYPILSAMASEPPSAEAKAKYDAAKKELLQALAKKEERGQTAGQFPPLAFLCARYPDREIVEGTTGGPDI